MTSCAEADVVWFPTGPPFSLDLIAGLYGPLRSAPVPPPRLPGYRGIRPSPHKSWSTPRNAAAFSSFQWWQHLTVRAWRQPYGISRYCPQTAPRSARRNRRTIPQQWDNLIGLTATGPNGDTIGKVGQVYLDEGTGKPEWVTVSTGMFGTRQSFAPLYGSSVSGDQLVLAVSKQVVKDAPNIDDDGHLSETEVTALYQHYATYLSPGSARTEGGDHGSYGGRHADEDAEPDTSNAGDAMTRSEERLHVGTESVPVGRARLRKYVVTENVTTTVPVSHEEVRLEREPITDANRDDALSGQDITEAEYEVQLHAERPVVTKETVPVERVRLATESVASEEQVSEEVRKEQIDEPDVETRLRDER